MLQPWQRWVAAQRSPAQTALMFAQSLHEGSIQSAESQAVTCAVDVPNAYSLLLRQAHQADTCNMALAVTSPAHRWTCSHLQSQYPQCPYCRQSQRAWQLPASVPGLTEARLETCAAQEASCVGGWYPGLCRP